MKQEVILELLETAAEKLAVKVSYEPLGSSLTTSGGMGGLCRVKGQYRVIIDKRATSSERVATLAAALATFDTARLELPAQVRDVLRFHEGSGRGLSPRAA